MLPIEPPYRICSQGRETVIAHIDRTPVAWFPISFSDWSTAYSPNRSAWAGAPPGGNDLYIIALEG